MSKRVLKKRYGGIRQGSLLARAITAFAMMSPIVGYYRSDEVQREFLDRIFSTFSQVVVDLLGLVLSLPWEIAAAFS